jgi:hypothetical protein
MSKFDTSDKKFIETIFFIYIWQHRFTLKFAMYRSLLCITVQYNKMVAVITVAYYYHIQNIFCTMLPLL